PAISSCFKFHSLVCQEIAQDSVENATVAIVTHLDRRIDSAYGVECCDAAVGMNSADGDRLAGFQVVVEIERRKRLCPIQSQAVSIFAGLVLQGQDAHSDEVGAVNA